MTCIQDTPDSDPVAELLRRRLAVYGRSMDEAALRRTVERGSLGEKA